MENSQILGEKIFRSGEGKGIRGGGGGGGGRKKTGVRKLKVKEKKKEKKTMETGRIEPSSRSRDFCQCFTRRLLGLSSFTVNNSGLYCVR